MSQKGTGSRHLPPLAPMPLETVKYYRKVNIASESPFGDALARSLP